METALFAGLAIILFWLVKLTIALFGQMPSLLNLSWPTLWLVAALGGILSLRTKRAILALGVTLVILCILLLRP